MFVGFVCSVLTFSAFLLTGNVCGDAPHLNGYYHMQIPNNGYQYVFFIDWSHSLNRYLVTVTGQPLAWATATLNIVDETTVDLICDNGDSFTGTIKYPTDLPSICWPVSSEFTCWNRLLSNVTRIHVINM